jgi:hypothetical protein
MSTHHYWAPPPAILDLLLSEVILRDLVWDPISYVFVDSKSIRPTYFRALIYKISGSPPPVTLDLPVSMVVLRGAQAVGLGSHLSHLIYIYKLKITKYMYMPWWPPKLMGHRPLHRLNTPSVGLDLGYALTYGAIANA